VLNSCPQEEKTWLVLLGSSRLVEEQKDRLSVLLEPQTWWMLKLLSFLVPLGSLEPLGNLGQLGSLELVDSLEPLGSWALVGSLEQLDS